MFELFSNVNSQNSVPIIDFLTTGINFSRDDGATFTQKSLFKDYPDNSGDVIFGLKIQPDTSIWIAYQIFIKKSNAETNKGNILQTDCFIGQATADSNGEVILHSEFDVSGLGPLNPTGSPEKYIAIVRITEVSEMASIVDTVDFQVKTGTRGS